mgnify:CR=1 FL=1
MSVFLIISKWQIFFLYDFYSTKSKVEINVRKSILRTRAPFFEKNYVLMLKSTLITRWHVDMVAVLASSVQFGYNQKFNDLLLD